MKGWNESLLERSLYTPSLLKILSSRLPSLDRHHHHHYHHVFAVSFSESTAGVLAPREDRSGIIYGVSVWEGLGVILYIGTLSVGPTKSCIRGNLLLHSFVLFAIRIGGRSVHSVI